MSVSHLDPFDIVERPRRSWIANLFRREAIETSAPDGVAESIIQAKIYEALLPLHARQQGRIIRNVTDMLKDFHEFHDPSWKPDEFDGSSP